MCLDKIKHFEIYVDSRVKEAILNIITKFKNMISSKDVGAEEPAQNNVADDIINITSEPVEENNPFSEPEPVVRRVIKVPEVADDIFPPVDENKVLITLHRRENFGAPMEKIFYPYQQVSLRKEFAFQDLLTISG